MDVDPSCRIYLWCEETFGPVIAISTTCTFIHEEQAIELANDTSSGLLVELMHSARMFRVAERLENGIVGINKGIFITANAPFGGVKESGLGRT